MAIGAARTIVGAGGRRKIGGVRHTGDVEIAIRSARQGGHHAAAAAAEITQIGDRPVALHASEQTGPSHSCPDHDFCIALLVVGNVVEHVRAAEPEAAGAVRDDGLDGVAVRELRERQRMFDAVFLGVKRR